MLLTIIKFEINTLNCVFIPVNFTDIALIIPEILEFIEMHS